MVKLILLPLLITACARVPLTKTNGDEVTVNAALNQAQMSYLKGCVEARKELKSDPDFPGCREKSKAHRLELEGMMDYNK